MYGAPGLYSRDPSCFFGVSCRSMSSFAEASEDTRCAFFHGFTTVAFCVDEAKQFQTGLKILVQDRYPDRSMLDSAREYLRMRAPCFCLLVAGHRIEVHGPQISQRLEVGKGPAPGSRRMVMCLMAFRSFPNFRPGAHHRLGYLRKVYVIRYRSRAMHALPCISSGPGYGCPGNRPNEKSWVLPGTRLTVERRKSCHLLPGLD